MTTSASAIGSPANWTSSRTNSRAKTLATRAVGVSKEANAAAGEWHRLTVFADSATSTIFFWNSLVFILKWVYSWGEYCESSIEVMANRVFVRLVLGSRSGRASWPGFARVHGRSGEIRHDPKSTWVWNGRHRPFARYGGHILYRFRCRRGTSYRQDHARSKPTLHDRPATASY